MRTSRACVTLEDVDVECTHCGVRMATHTGSGGTVRYFNCPSCQRWVTSQYTEVFRADAKVRTTQKADETQVSFATVKERLERWFRAIDLDDPYQALGVDPRATDEHLRARYRELARTHHPDRGGSSEAMQRINDAFERVLARRAAKTANVGRPVLAPGVVG